MKAQIKSALAAGLYLGIGLAHVCSPFWWRSKLRNPFEPEGFELERGAAFWYRVDQLSQSLRGRANDDARQRWIDAAHQKALTMPEGSVGAVDEFDWSSRPIEEFYEHYLRPCRPVVFRGLMRDHTELRRWRLDRLLEEFAAEEVRLSCPANPDYRGKMAELDIPGVYMHNSESLFARHPRLLRELGVASMAKGIRGPLLYGGVTQLFAGRKRTGSPWHCAPPQNYFSMLSGRKKWSFIEPSYSPLLAPYHASGAAVYWLSESSEQGEGIATLLDRLDDRDRQAVLEASTTELHRKVATMYTKCPRLEVELEPGDVLSVPPWWWHKVDNLTEQTVATATRWFDPTAKVAPNPDLEALLMLRPAPAYNSSLPAFMERLMTLDGELIEDPDLAKPAFDVEAGTALTAKAYADVREDVEAYYARQRAAAEAQSERSIAS